MVISGLPGMQARVTFAAMKNGQWSNRATQSPPVPPGTKDRDRRSDAGRIRFTSRDVRALILIAEHYAAPYDLLGAYLGVTQPRLRGIIARWKRAGMVDTAALTQNRGWVWVTPPGMQRLGYPWKAARPSLARVAHIRAVLACRLQAEAWDQFRDRGAVWRSEREIRAAVPAVPSPDHIVDAEIIWPDTATEPGQKWAVEVELTPKELDRTIRIIGGLLSQAYQQVVYLCAPPALPIVKRAAATFQRWPEDAGRLAIREVPPAALM